MYEIFELLLKQSGYKAADISRATGISQTVFSEWKKGKSSPKADKIQLIADFFGVRFEYLNSGIISGNQSDVLTSKDERDIAKKLNSTIDQLDAQDGLMFDGEALDDETKELLKISLENAIRTAKITAKKKYTPKKYRKDN
jgi:transcriptional regulator with XRE-family HTH domain